VGLIFPHRLNRIRQSTTPVHDPARTLRTYEDLIGNEEASEILRNGTDGFPGGVLKAAFQVFNGLGLCHDWPQNGMEVREVSRHSSSLLAIA
jgi:hypothetical protein